ncbi:hypothetical protein BBJ28_00021170 [Nothophytophthora sp. Chile5]|nr:hypothetical protein BBJ28_00021170 [Nothophytophthora sp. Chile5]
MRMRLLENGHRLMFVASHTVHLELHTLAPISPEIIVDWCRGNSAKFITNHLTMWSANGVQFVRKREVMAIDNPSDDSFLEEEVLKLANMYGMERKEQPLKDIAQQIVDRVGRLSQGGAKKFAQVLGEEQERQLEPEQEDERERELPPPKKALRPVVLHPFVVRLAKTGAWPPHSSESDAITSFPVLFKQTTAASQIFEKDWTDRQIYLTKEFTRTVTLKADDRSDFYIRAPVWTIWLCEFEVILFISPFEVNALWDDFKKNTKVALSPVAARLRPSQTMMFESPGFCVTHVHLSPVAGSEAFLQLMLAVGTLYLGSQHELDDYIDFLGLCPHPRTEAQTRHYDAQRIAMSGFVAPESRALVAERLVQRCRFSQDPTPIARQICRLFGWAHLLPHSHAGELLDNVTRWKVELAETKK